MPGGKGEEFGTELVVKELTLKKDHIQEKEGFTSSGTVNAVRMTPPPSWKSFPVKEANQLQWNIELTDRGLKLNPFTADLSGIRLKLNGQVDGNLLDETSDPTILAQAEISSELGTFFLANLNDEDWNGSIELKAKIQAKLKNIAQSLRGDFSVQGSQFAWKKVTAEQIKAEGSIDLKDQKLALKGFELFQQHPVSGEGKIKITATNIPLKMDAPFQAQVELTNADLHWLGSVVPKDIYPLEAKMSGRIQAQFTAEKKSWRLKAQTDLRAEHFALTNQRIDKVKPKKYILKPELPIEIVGPLEISPRGVDFGSLKVKLNRSEFLVSGGVHSGSGFEMLGKGRADLIDLREIAGNEIRGEGDVEVHVHGPTSNVLIDFDAKVKDAKYMGLNFGNISGRITFDDELSELRFTNFHANQKSTFYSLREGFVNLGEEEALHLPFEIHVGKVEDFATILEPLIKKVSWFPDTLKGEVHGTAEISGKVETSKLVISSELEGSDWSWKGERARRVKLNFGFNQGTYYAKNVSILKTVGMIHGNIDFNTNTDVLNWNFNTDNFSLNDLDFFERLEIPAKTKIAVTSQGSGQMDHLKSKSEAKIYDTEIKGEKFDSSQFSLEVGESTLRANFDFFGKKLSSQLRYALIPKQPSSFKIDLNDFDFSPALLILNPKLLDDPKLVGKISGHMDLDFLSTQAELARGEIQVKNYVLRKTGASLILIDPINVPVQLGYFHFPASRIRSQNSEITMSGEGKKGDIDFRLQGQTDLSIAEFFSSSIQKAIGKAETDIQIRGPLKELKVNGDLDFTGAKFLMRFMQSPLEDMDGSIRFRQGLISVESIEGYLGDEVVSASGKIQTYTDRFPEMDLRILLEDNKIKMAPLDLVQARGTLLIKGSSSPYLISGNLEVPQALWTQSFGQSGGGGGNRGDRFLPKDKDKQANTNLFGLNLNINANQGFIVRNEIIDAEFKGKVNLIGPPDNPRLLGSGQLIQGRVLFKDRPFIFENAKIDFDDPYQLNPKFNASAISEVNQYKIRVLAYGRASQWKAEFSSTPFMPENEIFSVLASGFTASDSSRYKNRDRSYLSQGEAASLILHSMDFSKDVQSRTGFQFDVEEAVDSQTASSIFKPQNLSDNVAAPKLVIKRQVGRNIVLGFGSTVGVGSENQKEVNAEYKLTPAVSALGVWNNIEEVNTRETRTSFGLDLKFNRRFK